MPRRIPTMANPVRCRKCPVTHSLTTATTDLDGSFAELLAADWQHYAWKNTGCERWEWECPACRPPRTAMGALPRVEHPLPPPGPLERVVAGPPVICNFTRAITEHGKAAAVHGRLGLYQNAREYVIVVRILRRETV